MKGTAKLSQEVEKDDEQIEAVDNELEAYTDLTQVLETPACNSFMVKKLEHANHLASLGKDNLADLYCSDSRRPTMVNILQDKLTKMEGDVVFGESNPCSEAFDMIKVQQKENILKALSSKEECEDEIDKEIKAITKVVYEEGERAMWGGFKRVAKVGIKIGTSYLSSW